MKALAKNTVMEWQYDLLWSEKERLKELLVTAQMTVEMVMSRAN